MKKKPSRKQQVGQRILATRLHRGLSQTEVARRAGLAPSYLSRIETGRVHPTVRMALRISQAIGVSLEELVKPNPAERRDQSCPITQSGDCLMDLVETGSRRRRRADGEAYTPRQLRLLRQFLGVLQESSPSVEGALEALLGEMSKGDGKKKSH